MKNLYKKVLNCRKCKDTIHAIDSNMKPAIMTDNVNSAKILFIAQNPGVPIRHEKGKKYEDVLMHSRAGTLFIKAVLDVCALDYKDIYWTNLLKCPTKANRIPTEQELNTCFPYLTEQLTVLKKIHTIVLLGNTVKDYYYVHQKNIFKGKYTIIDFFHPAYIYRTGNYKLLNRLCHKIHF